MKKLAMLLSILLVLTLALTACGKKTVVGEWEGTVKMDEEIIPGMELEIDVVIEFNEDGEYEMTLLMESYLESLKRNPEALVAAVAEEQGYTSDELLEMAGMSAEEYVEMVCSMLDLEDQTETGEYEFEDGELIIDDEEVDFELKRDELTIETEGGTMELKRSK